MPMTPREMIKYLKKNGFEEIRQNEEPVYWKNGNRSLSLQGYEKGFGASNIKAGRVKIKSCLKNKWRYYVWKNYSIRHFFISRKKAAFGFRFQIFRNVLLKEMT